MKTPGAIERTGPLSWAQHQFWIYNEPVYMREWGHELVIGRKLDISSDTTIEDFREALRECARRFEALRTIYSLDDTGLPSQHVLSEYDPPVVEFDADEPHDIRERPGFRGRVETAADRIVRADFVANLIDLDGYAVTIVKHLIEARLGNGIEESDLELHTATHPIDLAHFESDAPRRAQSNRSMAWGRDLRGRAPQHLLPAPSKRSEDTARETRLYVPGAMSTVADLAAQCRVSNATVVQAMTAAAVLTWTGASSIFFGVAVSNRWLPGFRKAIARTASDVDCLMDFEAGEDTVRFLQRMHERFLRAYVFGSRDYSECTMERVQLNTERGGNITRPLFIEYLNFLEGERLRHEPMRERKVTSRSRPGGYNELRFDVSPRNRDLEIKLTSDDTIVLATHAERLANVVGDLIATAASEPATAMRDLLAGADIPAVEPSPDRIPFGNSTFSKSYFVTTALACPGVEQAMVFTGSGDRAEMRLYVTGSATLERFHEHFLTGTARDLWLRVPTIYLRTDTGPDDPNDESAWLAAGVADRLDPARHRWRLAPSGGAEVLQQAFEQCHPGGKCNFEESYAQTGGNYLAIRGMLRALDALGYEGAHPDDFVSVMPLALIARRLRPIIST